MLEDFIEVNELEAALIRLKKVPGSLAEAIQSLRCSLGEFILVKLFIDSSNEPLLLIFLASDELDEEKVKKLVNASSIRTASPKEAFNITGYEKEFIPPVSVYRIKTLMDEKVKEKKLVFSSGGKEECFLKISPQEIIEFNEGIKIENMVR